MGEGAFPILYYINIILVKNQPISDDVRVNFKKSFKKALLFFSVVLNGEFVNTETSAEKLVFSADLCYNEWEG